jgi:hypothetical protein
MVNEMRQKGKIKNAPYSKARIKDKAREAWMKKRVWIEGHFLPNGNYQTGSWVLIEGDEEE